MTRAIRKRSCKDLPVEAMTLASMLAALDRSGELSATRLRDLRSAVKSVANLLGDEPAAHSARHRLRLLPGSTPSTPLRRA